MMPFIADLITKDLRDIVSGENKDADPDTMNKLLEALFVASLEAEELSAREVSAVRVAHWC